MGKKHAQGQPEAAVFVGLPEHEHPLVVHEHQHSHPLPEHNHPHEHPHDHGPHEHLHEHDQAPRHEHRDLRADLRADLRGALRAMLAVVEIGTVNSEQVKAIRVVRVILGDAHGSGCLHENTAYEEGDVLVCQDCRAIVTPP